MLAILLLDKPIYAYCYYATVSNMTTSFMERRSPLADASVVPRCQAVFPPPLAEAGVLPQCRLVGWLLAVVVAWGP